MAVFPLSCSLKCSLNAAFSALGRKGNLSYTQCCCVLKDYIKQKYLCTLPRFTKPVALQIPSISLNQIYLTFYHSEQSFFNIRACVMVKVMLLVSHLEARKIQTVFSI